MLASAIFLLGEVRGMRAVVVADAVSYVLAGGLLWVATRGMQRIRSMGTACNARAIVPFFRTEETSPWLR